MLPRTDSSVAGSASQPVAPHVSVVVPVLDEEDNVEAALRRARGEPRRSSDGRSRSSSSTTAAATRRSRGWRSSRRRRALKVVRLRRNFGQTAAMAAGFDHARGDVIVPMDGDLQNDPADIALLLEKIDEGYDVVSGWRRDRQDGFVAPTAVADRQLADRPGHRRAPARLRLHAQGVPREVVARDAAVRRDAPLHPRARDQAGARITEVPVQPPSARSRARASTGSAGRSRCCSTC